MKRVVLLMLVVVGCGVPPNVPDSGTTPDAGLPDSGSPDAGFDAGFDAGHDAGAPDAGRVDAGPPDAGPLDAGRPDAGFSDCPVSAGGLPAFRLRAMAANLTSGNQQSYDPGHGARIIMGANPDVVMIQEFNYGTRSPADIASFVNSTFDGGFAYFRGVGTIPNGVISRWPLLAQGEWVGQSPDRRLTWAKVDLPGPNDLWVISVHLPTSSTTARDLDARTILAQLTDGGVPQRDYVLLGGDLNTDTRAEPIFTTLSDRFVTTPPYPADQDGTEGTNTSRTKPYDHVLASPCLAALQVPTVIGASVYDAGLVIDTQVYTPISELEPAQAADSASVNMQHMGVVKDFLIQP